jgi:integrase
MPSAWIYQDDKQVKKHGTANASWYVGWFEPDGTKRGKSCGPGADGKRTAEKMKKRLEAELTTGTYQSQARKSWPDFRREYEAKKVALMDGPTRRLTLEALDHFERAVRPQRMAALNTQAVDEFIARRAQDPGQKKGAAVSPATVNKELRHLRAALNMACEWGYLPKAPKFHMLREPKKLVTYIGPEHFAAIYRACDRARLPQGLPFPVADWWRGLLVFGYMTGWRISDLLGLRRDDLDLEAGTAITRWEDNKGKRDERVKLHPVIVAHVRKVSSFDPAVFPWNHNRRTLDVEFHRIQRAAGIDLPCHRRHEHTPACHLYGFHDLRRAFATLNASRLTADALQALMRHKSYQTTQRYINMTRQLDEAVDSLHVPDVLKGLG